jgi:hypothetical protein
VIGLRRLVDNLSTMIDAAETNDWTTVSLKYMKLRALLQEVLKRFQELFEFEQVTAGKV